jgi:hypothetical protein
MIAAGCIFNAITFFMLGMTAGESYRVGKAIRILLITAFFWAGLAYFLVGGTTLREDDERYPADEPEFEKLSEAEQVLERQKWFIATLASSGVLGVAGAWIGARGSKPQTSIAAHSQPGVYAQKAR